MDNHEIDVVLSDMATQSKPGSKFYSTKLRDINISLVGAPKFKFLQKGFPQSIVDTPMIMLSEFSQVRTDMDQYFEDKNINPLLIGEIEDISLLRLFALSGIAIVPIPKEAIKDDLSSGRLIKIAELKNVTSALWAITTQKYRSNILVRNLIDEFSKNYS